MKIKIKLVSIMEPKETLLNSYFPEFLRWIPSHPKEMKKSEEKILSLIKIPYETFYVAAGIINGTSVKIWTLKMTNLKG